MQTYLRNYLAADTTQEMSNYKWLRLTHSTEHCYQDLSEGQKEKENKLFGGIIGLE